jgi:eukaryotic-like serine/threonine-protein kinase
MARRRDLPPDPPPEDPRGGRVPPEDMPTQPIDVDDPYVREPPQARRRVDEVYEEPLPPPEEPRSWWRENLWVWLLLLLLVVVVGIALIWFLQRDDGGGDRAVVPAVVGMSEADAVQEIEAAGLEPVANPAENQRPEGEVFAQAPGGGTQLEEGEPVVISVSTGPPSTTTVTTTTTATVTQPPPPANVTLPDVVGQSQVEAGDVLEGNGVVADSYPVPSDEPAGTVISQNPAAGTVTKEGETVRLNVSLGPAERETADIPDVTGDEASAARQRARVEGFTVRTVYRKPPSQEEVGEVLTQAPTAGATAPILTQITLFVGR